MEALVEGRAFPREPAKRAQPVLLVSLELRPVPETRPLELPPPPQDANRGKKTHALADDYGRGV
jgi:hypothetical protein